MVGQPLRAALDWADGRRRPVLDALFSRELSISEGTAVEALGIADLDRLVAHGLVRRVRDVVEPLVRIERVGGILIASDRHGHAHHRDFVLGPGPAGYALAAAVQADRPLRALDLGCGSGIQGLLLASRGAIVLGLDISARALEFSRFNASLNDLAALEVRHGDFLTDDPDVTLDGAFDLAVANPPFVLSPGHDLVYRDRPLPRDQVSRRTVERVARALAPGGRGVALANWIGEVGLDWSAPVRGWVARLGVDATVTRVAEDSPRAYALRWTRGLPAAERAVAVAAWTATLESEGVNNVEFGIINLERPMLRSWRSRRFEAIDRRSPAAAQAAAAQVPAA